jgi:hypothetical protein
MRTVPRMTFMNGTIERPEKVRATTVQLQLLEVLHSA